MAEDKKSTYKHIVRVANVDIPGQKPVQIALTKIKGVGKNYAHAICTAANVSKSHKTGDLTDEMISKLNEVVKSPSKIPTWMYNRKKDYDTGVDKHIITGDLHFAKDNDLKRLKKVKTLRGVRHHRNLPVRGQRTRSNFRKSKGKVVGVKKKGTPGKK
jgi:small subunit ribosomal protein S13